MKTLAAIILVCVTVAFVATFRCAADYELQKRRLDIEQQRLQLDVLNAINAQNEKAEREMNRPPVAQKPSLELNNL